jgi:hypothetical protein
MKPLVVSHQILNGIKIFIIIGNVFANQRFFEEYCDVAKLQSLLARFNQI